MNFSQRIGKVDPSKKMQLESLDDDLINGLWNSVKIHVLDELVKTTSHYGGVTEYKSFAKELWIKFYKKPIDTIPSGHYDIEDIIRSKFYNSTWHGVYDFIEFIAGLEHDNIRFENDEFIEFCNENLEKENAGYRFINGLISPITNNTEIKEISEAINICEQFSALRGANIHLKKSLEKFSDKANPDYRNSVKESISAVESVAKLISGNKNDSLAGALDKIKGKTKIHPALERAFKQIYGYTSDGDGIRHAIKDEDNCDFEEAKFMLVSCSAFVNYLISKAEKNGINIKE